MRKLIIAAVVAAFLLMIPGRAPAEPWGVWYLDFHLGMRVGAGDPFKPEDRREWKYALPTPIVIKKKVGEPEVYWFLIYTIKNKDVAEGGKEAKDHPLMINVSAISDKANASEYGIAEPRGGGRNSKTSAIYNDLPYEDVKKAVEKKLLSELRVKVKLWSWRDLCMPEKLDAKAKITDKREEMDKTIPLPMIKAGKWHRCIAIFDKMDPEADIIKVYFQGLTNDYQLKTHFEDPTLSEFERRVEEKVYEVTFERKGDEFDTLRDEITFKDKKWVTWKKKISFDLKHSEDPKP